MVSKTAPKQLGSKPPTMEEPILGGQVLPALIDLVKICGLEKVQFFRNQNQHLSLLHIIHVAPERNEFVFFVCVTITHSVPPGIYSCPPSPRETTNHLFVAPILKGQTNLLQQMPERSVISFGK